MPPITQPATVPLLGKAVRQPGTYLTSAATIPEGVYGVGLKDTLTVADASDPATRFTITAYVSSDGVTWQAIRRIHFVGGTRLDKNSQTVPHRINTAWSSTAMQTGAWNGWQARVELNLPVRLSLGFDATMYPSGFGPQ